MPRGSSPQRERQYERVVGTAEARMHNIKGRSAMAMAELERALAR
jgi:hypothetical protein